MNAMTAATSRCTEHGHPEFRLTYDETLQLDQDARALVRRLEADVAGGQRYADGDSLPVGWLHCRVKTGERGALTVWEPDMVFFPPHWVEGVNHALIHLRLQTGVVASLSATHAPLFPCHNDLAWISDDLGEAEGLAMYRRDPARGHSGWCLTSGATDPEAVDPDSLRSISLYEVVTRMEPRPVPHLALPVGARVELAAGAPVITIRGETVEISPGSLFATSFGRG